MTFKGLLNKRISLNFQVIVKKKKKKPELRQSTGTINFALTVKPNYESHFSNMQQHYIIKFQNKDKKLKTTAMLLLTVSNKSVD